MGAAVMSVPEWNPRDEEQPTREEWDAYLHAEIERLTRERDEAIRERDDARAKLELTRKLAYDMLDYVRETGWQRVSVWQQRMTEIWGAGE